MVAPAATATFRQAKSRKREDTIDTLISELHAAERALVFIPPFDPVPQAVLDRIRKAQDRLEAHGVTF